MGKPRNVKISEVEETQFGVYVWQVPDGRWVGDDEGNFLSINSQKGDLRRIHEITAAARACGVHDGAPYFLSGRRKIDDEEYENQINRLNEGLLPDEYDIPALIEEMKNQSER